MSGEQTVRAAFAEQAVWCDRLGSPLTAHVVRELGLMLDRSSAIGRRVLDWDGPPDAYGDSVPLRLAGGLNALARRGAHPALAACYPPAPAPGGGAVRAMLERVLADIEDDLLPWLDHPPQTNEVARSAILHPGFMRVAAETGRPLHLWELGASGGLNLQPDRYAYDLGGRACGAPGAPVRMAPDWTGPAPEGPEPRVLARFGCDRNPLRIADPAERERLVAYVWPDQPARVARIEGAIRLALADPPQLDRMDADAWLAARLAEPPAQGVARVVFHSIAFQYFPAAAQDRIRRSLAAAGAGATADTPLAWLSFEQAADRSGPELHLTLWPGGGTRLLARANAHVQTVEWLA